MVTIIDVQGCRNCGRALKEVKRKACDDMDGDVVYGCGNPDCSEKGRGRYTYRTSKTASILPAPVDRQKSV